MRLVEQQRQLKNYRKFVSDWLRIAYKWQKENPEFMTGWKFGHDWNSDYGYRNNYNDEKEYTPYYQFGKLPDNIRDGVFHAIATSVLCGIIDTEEKLEKVCEWLETNLTISKPHNIYSFYSKPLGYFCYTLYNFLRELELEITKNES